MNTFRRIMSTVAIVALTLGAVPGCGHLGASYAPAMVPNNRGIVYVYRPSQHRGSAVKVKVAMGDASQASGEGTMVGMLENGGYVPLTALGTTRILFPYAKKFVDINVEAGKSYYVRLAMAPSMFDPAPENGTLVVVDEAAARGEIADTNLQEDAVYRGN